MNSTPFTRMASVVAILIITCVVAYFFSYSFAFNSQNKHTSFFIKSAKTDALQQIASRSTKYDSGLLKPYELRYLLKAL